MKAYRSGVVSGSRLPVVIAMLVVCCAVLLPAGAMLAADEPGSVVYLPTVQSSPEGGILRETPETGDGGGIDPAALPADRYTLWYADFESRTFPGGVVVSGLAWP